MSYKVWNTEALIFNVPYKIFFHSLWSVFLRHLTLPDISQWLWFRDLCSENKQALFVILPCDGRGWWNDLSGHFIVSQKCDMETFLCYLVRPKTETKLGFAICFRKLMVNEFFLNIWKWIKWKSKNCSRHLREMKFDYFFLSKWYAKKS